jgi:hypothetical protein
MLCGIRLPTLYPEQEIFGTWSDTNPHAQCFIAPSGTKVGKSFGSAVWLTKEALVNPGLYCVWVGPTYLKAKIGYRYIKAMLPEHPSIECLDGKLEIRLGNRSFIKFLHGKDAETTVEGEAVDRFVVDESGKQSKQLWYSLFTTITQTQGLGIVTGTPRGFTWYYDIFRQAKAGDPFFVWKHLKTEQSPYVNPKAIIQAKRLLPKALFDQYYNAMFVSMSTVFGDISSMFDESLKVNPVCKFWVHPDANARALDTVTGWDMAKHRDYSVFYTVNTLGKLVGYARFRKVAYEVQVDRLKHYLHTYFTGDRILRYDATGVGSAVGEMISEKDIDASTTAVIFSQKSKQEMVSRTSIAIENGWHKAPRIEQIEHEFGSYELTVTKSGLFSYSAPDGEHDDVVSAAMLAISGAFQLAASDETEKFMEKLVMGNDYEEDEDLIASASKEFFSDDDFFDGDGPEEDDDFDFNDIGA